MIFHEQPNDDWTPFDFLLLEAYQMLQDEICPKCGHPIWLCRSDSPNVEFRVDGAVCQAERALKAYEDQKASSTQKADRATRKTWGTFYYTMPFTPDNIKGDLPTRDEFYAAMSKEKESDTVN